MGDSCCAPKASDIVQLSLSDRRILWIALILNFGCFVLEMVGGVLGHSVSLGADSLDMLGDGVIYALTLGALHQGTSAGRNILRLKSGIMAISGLAFLLQSLFRFFSGTKLPDTSTMTSIGMIALVANLICTVLFLRFRKANLNLRSAWICSRNDAISNVGILGAAWMVSRTGSAWPDLLAGLIISVLVLYSSFAISQEVDHTPH
jgi:Co/Zn/Cd efflux system component